jgi:hypothetical protein
MHVDTDAATVDLAGAKLDEAEGKRRDAGFFPGGLKGSKGGRGRS